LKLIDNNAAFPNLIFLTAYDKGQLNKHFEEKGETPYTPAIALILALNQSLKDLMIAFSARLNAFI